MKLKVGDEIKVLIGKDKGKTGKVEKALPKKSQVLVTGINIYKRHVKGRTQGQESGIKEVTKPLAASRVALICPKCKMVTRLGYKIEDGKKTRICRKCEQAI